jgi:hypothetical protein
MKGALSAGWAALPGDVAKDNNQLLRVPFADN